LIPGFSPIFLLADCFCFRRHAAISFISIFFTAADVERRLMIFLRFQSLPPPIRSSADSATPMLASYRFAIFSL